MRRARTLGAASAVILASIAFVMELVLVPVSLKAIQGDMGFSLIDMSWFFNVYAVSVAISVLIGGVGGVVFDKRLLFSLGACLFAVGSAGSALASDLQMLLLGRLTQGIGGGLFSPFVPVLLSRSFPENPGRILMIWGGLAGVVATVSPLLVDPAADASHWRMCFWGICIAATAALALYALCAFHAADPGEPPAPRSVGFPAIRMPWTVLAYTFLTYGCFTFFVFYYPMQLELEASDIRTGLVFATVWSAFSVLSFVIGARMNDALLTQVLNAAPLLLGGGFVLAVALPPGSSGILLAAALIGAGLACSNAPSTDLLLKLTPDGQQTLASSLDITFARLGGFVAVVLLSGVAPVWAAAAVAACSLLALLACRTSVGALTRAQSA